MDGKQVLIAVNAVMPFGKYTGTKLLHLPEPYLVWFHNKGFPDGVLGQQLALVYELKVNGLEALFVNEGGMIKFKDNQGFVEGSYT